MDSLLQSYASSFSSSDDDAEGERVHAEDKCKRSNSGQFSAKNRGGRRARKRQKRAKEGTELFDSKEKNVGTGLCTGEKRDERESQIDNDESSDDDDETEEGDRQGRWPGHVFIPIPANLFEDVIESFETDASWFLNSQLRNEKCRGKSDEGKGNRNSGEETGEEGAEKERPITFKRVQDPHISLSKRFWLSQHEIEPFLAVLKSNVSTAHSNGDQQRRKGLKGRKWVGWQEDDDRKGIGSRETDHKARFSFYIPLLSSRGDFLLLGNRSLSPVSPSLSTSTHGTSTSTSKKRQRNDTTEEGIAVASISTFAALRIPKTAEGVLAMKRLSVLVECIDEALSRFARDRRKYHRCKVFHCSLLRAQGYHVPPHASVSSSSPSSSSDAVSLIAVEKVGRRAASIRISPSTLPISSSSSSSSSSTSSSSSSSWCCSSLPSSFGGPGVIRIGVNRVCLSIGSRVFPLSV